MLPETSFRSHDENVDADAEEDPLAFARRFNPSSSTPSHQHSPEAGERGYLRRSLDMITANLRTEEERGGPAGHNVAKAEEKLPGSRRSLDTLLSLASMTSVSDSLREEEGQHRNGSSSNGVENLQGGTQGSNSDGNDLLPNDGSGPRIEQKGRHRLRVRRSLTHITTSLEELLTENVSDMAAEAAEQKIRTHAEYAASNILPPVVNVEFDMDDCSTTGTGHFINMINNGGTGGRINGTGCSTNSVMSSDNSIDKMKRSHSAGALSMCSALTSEVLCVGPSSQESSSGLSGALTQEQPREGLPTKKSALRMSLDFISMALEKESLGGAGHRAAGESNGDDAGGLEEEFAAMRQRLEQGAARASGGDLESVRRNIKAAGSVTSHMALEVLCAMAKEDTKIVGSQPDQLGR
mmetsp:Transcript_31613/g.58267  ORF Transcript_31613/g.58267 Transcript_31613/m.58267 type:complete len:409 (-) Transcript_31613:32-1258(-)|eukprot:CAMPEP_0197444472 /NCGR_PEP_ID=MMETSP1175-20131217/9959_1 /TAXON_ID=1003142 /ORGANISM="Triceratium dubium, Strain CCMP147" /LENGTH=408 /DNA_ID=CAMNT_0042975277 /DNA_START=110 /DNA_END=1336 /DNA_ORIENTATION=+